MCAMLSHFSRVRLFATPWTVACQASLSMEFSRQEYWSEKLFPSPGSLPDPGIEPASLTSPALAGRFFTASATWEAHTSLYKTCLFDILYLMVLLSEVLRNYCNSVLFLLTLIYCGLFSEVFDNFYCKLIIVQ